jgi:rod shape-determining protein MreB
MGRDLAIDLGTANTLVYRAGAGIVLNEPTIVAIDESKGEVVAIGHDVWQMIGSDSGNVIGMRPLRAGAITEFEVTQRFLEGVIRRVAPGRLQRPRVLICIPSESSEVEKRAIEEAVEHAGGKQVTLVEEPLAAAIGAGLPVHEPMGNLVVDVGGARSEMAVVSMGGVVSGHAIRVGGFDVDVSIQEHIRTTYGVAIGERSAEEIKLAIGSAFPSGSGRAALVVGRDLSSGNSVEDPFGSPARIDPRRPRDRDVPHGRWQPAQGPRCAAGPGVRGAGPRGRATTRDGGARRGTHARASR